MLVLGGCGSDPGGDADELFLTCTNAGSGRQACFIVQGPISTGTCTTSEGGSGIDSGTGTAAEECDPGDVTVAPPLP